jgi:hypothetical protein
MPESTLAQWREANRVANEAADSYFKAAIAYARGHAPEPSPAAAAQVKRLREAEKSLFSRAMAELNLREASLRGLNRAGVSDPGSSEQSGRR